MKVSECRRFASLLEFILKMLHLDLNLNRIGTVTWLVLHAIVVENLGNLEVCQEAENENEISLANAATTTQRRRKRRPFEASMSLANGGSEQPGNGGEPSISNSNRRREK